VFVVDGLLNAFRMGWEVWWALALGFLLSAIVQAWVPRARMQSALGGAGLRQVALATGFGAASSSCSYAAIAIAKSMFQKGASFTTAMAFQFASTNLVFELGIVMWIFLGWQFTLAELVGGIVLIALMWLGLRLFLTRQLEEQAREHALAAQAGHQHHSAESERRLFSLQAWSDVAHNFRGDWGMLWKEIVGGFLMAGYISLLPMSFFNRLFITDTGGAPQLLENAVVGPIVAALSFVCSVGNIPLAAVLWAGGISFSGVLAFIYADLIVIPIVHLPEVLRRRCDRAPRRDHVRRDGDRRARRRRALQRARPRADAAAVDPLDHGAADRVELHDRAEHRVRDRRRGTGLTHAAARRARSRLRHDRGQAQDVASLRTRRQDLLLLQRSLQEALRRGSSRLRRELHLRARERDFLVGSIAGRARG
jgi:Predicted permeases